MSCTRCKLAVGRYNQVKGYGTPTADIFFYRYSPTIREDKDGLLMSNPRAVKFLSILQDYELDVDSIYITSVLKCRARGKVTKVEVSTCMANNLASDITIPPKVNVILGVKAFRALTNNFAVKHVDDLKGEFFTVGKLHNCILIPDYSYKVTDSNIHKFKEYLNKITLEYELALL